jgi:hypothetical protein
MDVDVAPIVELLTDRFRVLDERAWQRDVIEANDRRYQDNFDFLKELGAERQRFAEAIAQERDLRYQQRFDAQGQALTAALLAAEKAVQAALTAAQSAVSKAEAATEKRFESVNEFRGALTDQGRNMPSRPEVTALVGALADRVTALKEFADRATGRDKGLGISWAVILGGLGAIAVVYSVLSKFGG